MKAFILCCLLATVLGAEEHKNATTVGKSRKARNAGYGYGAPAAYGPSSYGAAPYSNSYAPAAASSYDYVAPAPAHVFLPQEPTHTTYTVHAAPTPAPRPVILVPVSPPVVYSQPAYYSPPAYQAPASYPAPSYPSSYSAPAYAAAPAYAPVPAYAQAPAYAAAPAYPRPAY